MELEGKAWKDGKFWLAEVPFLNVMTQGKTKKRVLLMIEDAILGLVACYFPKQSKDFKIHINHYQNVIGISSNNTKVLMAFSLKRQREMSKSTIREVTKR